MTTGKTIVLTRRAFVGKVMSLLFNMLSRLVITLIPRSKCFLISWLQSPSTVILEPPKIKSVSFHCFPIYFPWSDGAGCHDLFQFSECWALSQLFHSPLSLLSRGSLVLCFLPEGCMQCCSEINLHFQDWTLEGPSLSVSWALHSLFNLCPGW